MHLYTYIFHWNNWTACMVSQRCEKSRRFVFFHSPKVFFFTHFGSTGVILMRLIYYPHYITKVVAAFNFICKWGKCENTNILADVNRCIKTKNRLHWGIQKLFSQYIHSTIHHSSISCSLKKAQCCDDLNRGNGHLDMWYWFQLHTYSSDWSQVHLCVMLVTKY